MANERSVHSAIAIELFFKGKNYESFIDILAQQADASLPPSPELRADVVNDGNAALAHLPRHPPVKCGRVDDHGEGRAFFIGRANQFLKERINLRKMTQNFGDADDGEVFGVDH